MGHPPADSCAVFFEDPDVLRFEVVAERPLRREVGDRWAELEGFSNPLQRRKGR